MSEYIRVNINFLPENQTHMSVYNEIMEAKKNKIQPTEFLINTVSVSYTHLIVVAQK